MSNNETRLKRLAYRSRYTGTKETDVFLGQFAERHMPALTPALLDEYEALIENADPDLYMWISGRTPVPARWDTPIMRLLQSLTVDRANFTSTRR